MLLELHSGVVLYTHSSVRVYVGAGADADGGRERISATLYGRLGAWVHGVECGKR